MSASRHRRKPRLKLELCVQRCVPALRASLRSCAGAGRRPRRPSDTPSRRVLFFRQRPARGEAVRSYDHPLPGQSTGAGPHERAAAHQVRGGKRNGPPGRSFNRASSAAQRNAGTCRLYPVHRAHRIAWRGVAPAVDRMIRTSSSVLMHEGFNPAAPPCPESSRYAIE